MSDHENKPEESAGDDIWAALDAGDVAEDKSQSEHEHGEEPSLNHEEPQSEDDSHLNADHSTEEDGEPVDFSPKKSSNKLAIYAAAGVFALVGLGGAGFLVMSAFSGGAKTQKMSKMEQPLDSVAGGAFDTKADSSSLPGGSVGASSSGNPGASGMPAAAPLLSASNPSTLSPAIASPETTVSQTAMIKETPKSTQNQAPSSVVIPVAEPVVAKGPDAKVDRKSDKVAAPLTSNPQVAVHLADAPKKAVRVHASRPVKDVQREAAHAPVATLHVAKKPAKSTAKHFDVIDEAKETPKVDVAISEKTLNGYKIFAFSPSEGEYPMVYLRRGESMLILREGDTLPDGTRVLKIDMRNWKVVTSNGVIR